MTLYSEVDIEDYYDSLAIALIKKKGSAKFPTNEDLKTTLKDKDLYNIQSKNRNYMFEMLENYNNIEYVDTSNENITVEHIFPRNPDDDWSECLTNDEFFVFKEKLLNTIGNLTLSGNNGALSNKTFAAKKVLNINDGEQGYKYSRLWLNKYLQDIDNWTLTEYNTRFEIIFKRFLSIWFYPDVELPVEEENIEENIFAAEKPTNKKLEYFIFEDTKVEESAIAQMYFYVITRLYQINLPLLLKNQQIIKFSRTPADFRTPQELINGYFIEANIDSNTKFNILKKLLQLFEMEEDLFVKFSSENGSDTKSRFTIRKDFWKQILAKLEHTNLFGNISPSKESWLTTGAGISGIAYTLIITKAYVGIELTISRASKQENKYYFKQFLAHKEIIDSVFGKELTWEELPDNKMSRIITKLEGVSLYSDEDWPTMNAFIIENLPKFEAAFQPVINKIKNG